MATTKVSYVQEIGDHVSGADVTVAPGSMLVVSAPPDDIAFLVPLANGKWARLQVDATELEVALDEVHSALIEATADQHQAEWEPKESGFGEAAPPVPPVPPEVVEDAAPIETLPSFTEERDRE